MNRLLLSVGSVTAGFLLAVGATSMPTAINRLQLAWEKRHPRQHYQVYEQ